MPPTRWKKWSQAKRIWPLPGKPETLPGAVAFSMLENLAVVLIAPALPCPVRNQVSVEKPDWSTVPFIMADQGTGTPPHRAVVSSAENQ
ncbi:DNA-binding transcriptional regulator IlvY [Leclercia adecarboxylata]|uniref:DNA-binding transcriptional regulator IlvY n=1 Tax=Leclercia adecarboxylata TaxID=83655 RepID=A0A4U9IWG7_9ENTR|nr:DNA-binding transcriptional regulator IlvY [Leclercia adecarboxylata]